MKPNVSDFWSITPNHFKNAGDEGSYHFNFLMNRVIMEINTSSVEELNTAYALLLHKGHGKPKTNDRSYRTISTCPVLAKALDMYVHELFIDKWNACQADTQYQGQCSSHELAALLITECIQQSLYHHHLPIFLLFLDARSAFDTVVISFLIRNLYFAGMNGNSLLFMNNRLSNRITYCDWDKELMGPIKDEHGMEQGGCNSSEGYKLYNNDLLKTAQASRQGVEMGKEQNISAVGQADDVGLLANSIFCLFNILHLVLDYCRKFSIKLCASKTKLLMITNDSDQKFVPLNPINIDGEDINFANEAEHVGVIRSCDGNMPHLLGRFAAHKRAMAGALFCGTAKSHRGNPAASVKVEKLYGMPVLFSGMASLVLTKAEVNMVDQHYYNSLRNLLKVHTGTPHSFVLFMSGSLPGTALLHLRQLGLYSMITRLPTDPLNLRARHALTFSTPSCKSWFTQVRNICLLYGLPHPLSLLNNPLSKESFKKIAKSHVMDYWEVKLRQEASLLPSLKNFKPEFHSLSNSHPILWTAGTNPYEVSKALIQLKMLSGRYRTAMVTRHWTNNKNGWCPSPSCSTVQESLEHLLLTCPYYDQTRQKLFRLWSSTKNSIVLHLVSSALEFPPDLLLQFILDASTIPAVISLSQIYGTDLLQAIFHLTRS